MFRLIIFFSLCVTLAACAIPQTFAPIPLRDADLYPFSQTKDGVAVAVDQLSYPQRVEHYFGVNLLKAEVLPINIIISNHGQGRYVIRPSDILLMKGKEVIDPVPVKAVEATICEEYGRMSEDTARKVDDYFGKVTLQEAVLAPNDNYQGIIFLKAERRTETGANGEESFSMDELFREGSLKVRIAVTDVQTSARIHFGPFSLTGL